MRLPKPSFASAIALIALFISLGGTVYAAAKIDGKTFKKESIPGNRLKPGGIGGAQVNEAALAPVPSAARADEVASAAEAGKAGFATRAGEVDRAAKANEAAKAATALEAVEAESAERAGTADRAKTFGGKGENGYTRKCGDGTAKGAAFIDATAPAPTAGGFNCARPELTPVVSRVVRNGVAVEGEFLVRFEGIENARAIATATGANSMAVASGSGPEFLVKTFSGVNEALLGRELFTLAVF